MGLETILDCLVIGAGPAGTAAATALARREWRVAVVDRRPGIQQKVCGECLSPPSRELLTRLGAWRRIAPGSWRALSGIALLGPRGSRCLLDFGLEQPAFTVPRPVLDRALAETATHSGASLIWGQSIVAIERSGEHWLVRSSSGQQWRARILLGADGRHSWVARQIGLAPKRPHPLRHAAVMAHFEGRDPGFDCVEMHVAGWGYVGLNPLPGSPPEST